MCIRSCFHQKFQLFTASVKMTIPALTNVPANDPALAPANDPASAPSPLFKKLARENFVRAFVSR